MIRRSLILLVALSACRGHQDDVEGLSRVTSIPSGLRVERTVGEINGARTDLSKFSAAVYLNMLTPRGETVYGPGLIHDLRNDSAVLVQLEDQNAGARTMVLRDLEIRDLQSATAAIRVRGSADEVELRLENLRFSKIGDRVPAVWLDGARVGRVWMSKITLDGGPARLRFTGAADGKALAREVVVEDSPGVSFELDASVTRFTLPRVRLVNCANADAVVLRERKIPVIIDGPGPSPASVKSAPFGAGSAARGHPSRAQ